MLTPPTVSFRRRPESMLKAIPTLGASLQMIAAPE